MTKIFSLLFFLAVTALPAWSQTAADVPIGFINAVGLSSKTDFQIDGHSLKPAGFSAGASASSFGIAAGNHRFSFLNPGAEPVVQNVTIAPGVSPLFVLYKVLVKQGNAATKNVLKLVQIPPQASNGSQAFFAVSTLQGRRADIIANGQALSLEPLRVSPIAGSSLAVEKTGLKPLKATPREKGNYVLVLYDGVDGQLRWSLVEMTH